MNVRRARVPGVGPGNSSDFVAMAHANVFGAPPGRLARRRYAAVLERHGRVGVLNRMLADDRHADRMVAETRGDPGLSDEEFVAFAYRTLLGREPDPGGRDGALVRLAGGASRDEVVRRVVGSDEYRQRALARYFPLADLRALRPDRYGELQGTDPEPVVLFRAEEPADFDWLESAILAGGYYDKPGVWGLSIDTDKRLMAEIVAALAPGRVLELGCASGAVLQCLHDLGIDGEGIELSEAAIASAFPDVRGAIHRANAVDFELPSSFDAIFGLDIFEHLNPNRLGDCLKRVEAHLSPGGLVFANIPAFGADPVFGEVFPIYIGEWPADADRGRPFRALHCDRLGYPLNGHLIWARTDWWVAQFEAEGLRRETGIEAALHERYDGYLSRAAPARRSFYVFSKDAPGGVAARIEAAIRGRGSAVLPPG